MNAKEVLRKYWGYDQFRSLQEEIIQSVLVGQDVLALLPTGGGKSICFQVPAMILEGTCIVISPLIALMKDQVTQLKKRGVKAAAIYSGMSRKEIDFTLDNCIYGNYKFLYLSPERLATDLFKERLSKISVSLLAVDEAHCISQWGYDFRPSYLRISEFTSEMEVPVIALTATATKEVQKDIADKLLRKEIKVFEKSFARSNLSYSVFKAQNKFHKLLSILNGVAGSAIVYVRNRRQTHKVVELLEKQGISASAYHAGLELKIRDEVQSEWVGNSVRVVVATNAFGMGIDKPDVRSVIHIDLPDSLENYYQEAGRAGRDGAKSFAILLYDDGDVESLFEQLESAFPPYEELKNCYQSLSNYLQLALGSGFMETYDFDIAKFATHYNYKPSKAFNLLKRLAEANLIQLSEYQFQPSTLRLVVDKEDLYRVQVENEKIDLIIKAVLRLYGGELFGSYVEIKEYHISKMTGISEDDIMKLLNHLDKRGLLEYRKLEESSSVTFLTGRQDSSKLKIDQRRLQLRKKVRKMQVQAMVNYASAVGTCRTRIFQEYFGEESDQNCGVCDTCIAMRKSQLLDQDISDQILKSIGAGPCSVAELVEQFPGISEDRLIAEIRELLESKKLHYDSRGRLTL